MDMPLWVAIPLALVGFLLTVGWPAMMITISIMSTSDSYEAYHENEDGAV